MTEATTKQRLRALDIARGVAILCMASYHFSWDLEFFNYLDQGTVGSGYFKLYARLIASSFLFMAGVSLFLSHGKGIQWRKFAQRFCAIAAAALAVSVVTWFAMPKTFIFFGILHQIALASLLGLIVIRLPIPFLLLAGIGALLAPNYLKDPFFDQPWLWWVGLSETLPRSNDYVPFLPWIAPFLFGLSAAKILDRLKLFERLHSSTKPQKPVGRALAFAGRHSLAIYLIHQPLLFGLVWCFAQILPAPPPNPEAGYVRSCVAQCTPQEGEAFCTAFCKCTLQMLKNENLLMKLQSGAIDVQKDENILRISGECTMLSAQPGQ